MFLSAVTCFFALNGFSQAPQHVATTPVERLSEAWWKQRHEACVELTKRGGVDVIFVGDSITQGWEGGGKATWDKLFAPLKAANFGFSGDRTEHVLWRMEHGEMVGLNPKVIVMMIGTNNIGHGSSTPEQTADGVRAIVAKMQASFKNAKILLLGIFPRGLTPEDGMRMKVAKATELFMGLDDGNHVRFLDIGKFFMRVDGTLRTTMMPDLLHLNAAGYEIWGKAIEPTVREMLGEGIAPSMP
ncbi:MAG: hypothetical protein KF784_13195 [Fimbriimonadaceae bacterium]|nr:hypothetical protein [Fimbriimonadaceae bacterium]